MGIEVATPRSRRLCKVGFKNPVKGAAISVMSKYGGRILAAFETTHDSYGTGVEGEGHLAPNWTFSENSYAPDTECYL